MPRRSSSARRSTPRSAPSGSAAWAPIATGAAGLLLDGKGTVAVRLRFTATGDWQIDDLFVDPRKMG